MRRKDDVMGADMRRGELDVSGLAGTGLGEVSEQAFLRLAGGTGGRPS